jgi:hypothetical protein
MNAKWQLGFLFLYIKRLCSAQITTEKRCEKDFLKIILMNKYLGSKALLLLLFVLVNKYQALLLSKFVISNFFLAKKTVVINVKKNSRLHVY